MSNAKLKEQIEAAKIALVHSAEAGKYADKPLSSSNLTQNPNIGPENIRPYADSAAHADRIVQIDNIAHPDGIVDTPNAPVSGETQIVDRETIVQSDLEKLENRLQGLEDQIKNQQRDLHTLLQKLRGIAAKSQSAPEPKKSKGRKKSLVGVTLCMMGFGAVYYWLGTEVITSTLYRVIGFIMALIDSLAGKI